MKTLKHVMVLDDDAIIAMDIAEELTSCGWHVPEIVCTLAAAEEAFSRGHPDVAVMDISLPGGQSFALAERLRHGGAAVIFMSGSDPRDMPEGLEDCAFLQKPIDYDALKAALRAALATPGKDR